MAEHFLDPVAEPALAHAFDAARQSRARARDVRLAAAQTRWRARKERLRSRRLRSRSAAFGRRTLDDFIQIASVDELVEVLVELADRHGYEGRGPGPGAAR